MKQCTNQNTIPFLFKTSTADHKEKFLNYSKRRGYVIMNHGGALTLINRQFMQR